MLAVDVFSRPTTVVLTAKAAAPYQCSQASGESAVQWKTGNQAKNPGQRKTDFIGFNWERKKADLWIKKSKTKPLF